MGRRRKLATAIPVHRRLPTVPALSAGMRAANRAHLMARRAAGRLQALQTRRRRKAAGKGEHVGVFTKCWNKRVRRPSRRAVASRNRFAKRVRVALSRDLSKRVSLQEYALRWNISPLTVGSQTARCGWMQLGLNVLNMPNASSVYAYPQAYYDPMAVGATNPPGLGTVLLGGLNDENWLLYGGIGTTIYGTATNGLINANEDKVHRFEQHGCRMHMTLRNPNPYGYWVDIFYCRARKYRTVNDIVNSNLIGSYATQNYGAGKEFGVTPLECMAAGYPEVVPLLGATYHGFYKHASPQESPVFRRNWKVTKKCRVYLPPGGTLEKALVRKGIRVLTNDYVQKGAVDTHTEYLLLRACPEIQLSSSVGNNPAVPANTSSVVAGFSGLIGEACWRYTFKQIQNSSINDTVNGVVTQPATHLIVGGQAEPTNKAL